MSTIDTPIYHQDAPILPTAIKWGAISAVVACVLVMIFYNIGLSEPGNMTGALIAWVVTVGVGFVFGYLGLKNYRDGANEGNLTLGKGVVWGLIFGVVAGIIAAVFFYFFLTQLAPEFLNEMKALEIAKLEESGVGDDQIEMSEDIFGYFMNAPVMASTQVLNKTISGLIYGLIGSLMLKNR